MRRRTSFHVEVLFTPATEPKRTGELISFVTAKTDLVVTCLLCGTKAVRPLHSDHWVPSPFAHRCDDIERDIADLEGFSWKTVVRDAFLEGRDDEAIHLIREEMDLIALDDEV